MELRSGKTIHKSSVFWLRPRKWQPPYNNVITYNSLRYYIIKWRINCTELKLEYDKPYYTPLYKININFDEASEEWQKQIE